MSNEYTNLYDWCDDRQGQTLDNKLSLIKLI